MVLLGDSAWLMPIYAGYGASLATDGVSDDEAAAMGMFLLFAGHETTVAAIDEGALWLLACPDQWHLRRELLDRILILNERHLALVLQEYLIHYNGNRPHQSRQQRRPDIATQPARDVTDLNDLRSIRRKPVATGTTNEYHHAA